MKTTCTRKLEFDAAHRVMNHESKCATLHGHRYVIEVTASGDLDPIGRVVDFSVIKANIGGWIDTHWDHTTLLGSGDVETIAAVSSCPNRKPVAILPCNPTAENLAQFLLLEICPRLLQETGVAVTKIRVWETPNCYAEAVL